MLDLIQQLEASHLHDASHLPAHPMLLKCHPFACIGSMLERIHLHDASHLPAHLPEDPNGIYGPVLLHHFASGEP